MKRTGAQPHTEESLATLERLKKEVKELKGKAKFRRSRDLKKFQQKYYHAHDEL